MKEPAELHEPLTPPDCDLRGLEFMPLDVVRLVDSDLFAWSSGEEFKAAVALWCKAWLQIPAGSLPDDDRSLTNLSGLGRDIKAWIKVKDMALHGFIKCSDGRLYHPVIAEKAIDAMNRREEHRDKQESNAERQRRWREEQKHLCDELRKLGVKPPRGASKETLLDLLDSVTTAPQDDVTRNAVVTVTTPLHSASRNADVMPKTGTGTGTGTREKNIRTPKADAFGVLQILETFPTLDESVASDFLKHRKAKRAPLTQSAWDAISREIMSSGWTPDKALRETMARGWQSFKADWVAEKPQRFGSKTAPEDISNWVPASMRGTPDDPLFDGDYIDAIQ